MIAAPLLLTYEYGQHVYGGLGRHVTNLAAALADAGAAVSVATLGDRDRPAPERYGIDVIRTPPLPRLGQGDDWLPSVLAFDTSLTVPASHAALSADVIHAHDWFAARTAITLCRERDIPLVVTVHATERGRHQGWLPDVTSRFIDGVERWLAASADHVITCSDAMRDAVLRQWELDSSVITVVPNAVRRDVAARAPDANRVLFAGRLEHEKGGQVLLAAARRLIRSGTDLKVVVAGTGSRASAWRDLALELGINGHVEFTGHLDWPSLAVEYARATVVAVPSLYEPSGMVAAEALASGAPVVASAVDGLCEVVGGGGVLVPRDDAAALAAALEHLLSSTRRRRVAAEAARRRAEQLPTWEETAASTLEVYAAAMDRSTVWSG